MKVADVMTENPLTVGPQDTIRDVEDILDGHNFRQLPVVRGTELLGIITDRDIRSFIGGRVFESLEDRDRAMNTTVETVMTTKPVTLSPEDELRDAVELLIEEKIGGIPVVNGEEGLVGIVTHVDLLRCFLDYLET